MKIEKTKPKKNISEVVSVLVPKMTNFIGGYEYWSCHVHSSQFFQPPLTKEMITRLLTCSEEELVEILRSTVVWRFGKVSVITGCIIKKERTFSFIFVQTYITWT